MVDSHRYTRRYRISVFPNIVRGAVYPLHTRGEQLTDAVSCRDQSTALRVRRSRGALLAFIFLSFSPPPRCLVPLFCVVLVLPLMEAPN